MLRTLAVVAFVAAVVSTARADDWPAPTTKYVKSDSGRYRAVVVPGARGKPGSLELYDDRDPTRPKKLYRRAPVNQVAPVKALLSDGGQLVTVDEWHNAGYKHALVIYDRKGKVVVDCALEHLLLSEELAEVKTSVSSRWWRAEEEGEFWLDGAAALIKTAAGPLMRIDLATGVQTRDGQRVVIPGSDRCRARKKP
ncbi:MAG TPA: hypothetical protein VFU21_09045 [Kofleriaceae bacterium]|nr:hypothetical protein [Kofleriaceae bacterium]